MATGASRALKYLLFPIFGGNRQEWPEFKAVCSSYALSKLVSETEKMWGLKQCLRGKALEHVKAIMAN